MNLELAANTIRVLTVDAVQKANSGHPGMPMGTADFAAVLFLKHLKHFPQDKDWPDRDRFILSPGHGSMLLYSLLHLSGYDLKLDELKSFRQWNSRTPGHPEYGLTPGVETSTGPLGQGCANAVGMALAEAMLAEQFNAGSEKIVDHYTYGICSDGDLMEGISHEAFSLAGHLGLHKLIFFYDCNRITIEGSTALAYSDDVRKRFEGYHWNVLEIDGHDYAAIDRALTQARQEKSRPTLIIGRTVIAKGSPHMAGNAEAHGAPLGSEEVKAVKINLGFSPDREFAVPDEVYAAFAARSEELNAVYRQWRDDFENYRRNNPAGAKLWDEAHNLAVPEKLEKCLPMFDVSKPLATRSASHKIIQSLAKAMPCLAGGSADLAPSTRTIIDGAGDVGPKAFAGRNFHFGIREHAMGAMLNGMALHNGLRVYGATFFVFSDYFRPAIRMACIMKLPVIYVLTHDSFYVGEDGPSHEPVEHIMALRLLPNMTVIRPADPTETGAAWIAALKNTRGPTAILLTRQNVPVLDRAQLPPASRVEQGAYTLWQSAGGRPQFIIIATGSEVQLALDAARALAQAKQGLIIRVVSMPSWELFELQPEKYRRKVLPPACKRRLVLEAGRAAGWEKYAGPKGRVFGLEQFGASAPYKILAKEYGFTTENIVRIAGEMTAG
ncbi:MAG: transketolase [Kiritimatiellae bacterium]|nr:transketolase [Kiritimatiellia bacterium]